MSNRVRKSSAINANLRLPENLGELLLGEVMNLPDCPKGKYLKSEYLTKFVSKDTAPPEVRRKAAIDKWLATERMNEETNVRLMNTHPEFQILPGVEMEDFMDFLRGVVCDVIGETVPEEALVGAYSGGASTSRKRTESQPARKYLGKAHVTSRASDWVEVLRDLLPGWSQFWDSSESPLEVATVTGNVMFTVPKSTDIDRCACKEPDVNMFLQKGAGRVIRRALKRAGIDLNDQSRNRSLAREGSISGALATLDLSSASDSVSRELVFQALPVLWFSHLDSLRSPVTVIDGQEHVNEMFSSMGNGFTFELESLLFYAIARTTAYFTGTRGVISVYGDDIIAPTPMYQDLVWVLSYLGFKVNTKKSFAEGPFRESCGGHFASGYDITPFYVKEPIERLSDLIQFCNALRRWSEIPGLKVNDPSVFPLWEFAASFVPKRFWGANDPNQRYQLYTPGIPRDRLVPDSKRSGTGTGGYIHWLNATAHRNEVERDSEPLEAISTSESTMAVENPRMRVRRAPRTVNLDKPLFPQEQLLRPSNLAEQLNLFGEKSS